MYKFNTSVGIDGKKKLYFLDRTDFNYFLIAHLDYVLMCDGNTHAAILLGSIEHLILSQVQKGISLRGHEIESDYWAKMSYSYIRQRIFNSTSPNTVKATVKFLQDRGYLIREKGSDTETYRYTLAFERLRRDRDEVIHLLNSACLADNGKIPFDEIRTKFDTDRLVKSDQAEPVGKFYLVKSDEALSQICLSTQSNLTIRSSSEEALEIAVTPETQNHNQIPSFTAINDSLLLQPEHVPTANAFGTTLKEVSLIDATGQQNPTLLKHYTNQNETKETAETMSEAELILKRYERSPKPTKNQKFRNMKLVKLNQDFREKTEAVIAEYGYEAALAAMDAFLANDYWKENGQPLPAFFKQIDQWMGEDQIAESAPRTKSYSILDTEASPIAPRGCNAQKEYFNGLTPEQIRKSNMALRRDEALRVLKQAEHPEYDAAWEISCRGFDHLTVSMVESWMSKGLEKWNSTHEWPLTVVSRPLVEE